MLMLHISDIHFKKDEAGEPDDPNRGLRNDMIEDVRLVMCHHPFNWIKNRGPFEDRMNAGMVQIQLFGHEHTERVETHVDFVRVRAGALQPDRDGPNWKPGYNWIDVATSGTGSNRKLVVRIWPRMHEVDRFIAVTNRKHEEAWTSEFEFPEWRPPVRPGAVRAKEPVVNVADAAPITPELPMVEPGRLPNVRSVTTKIFRLKEHEARRLIASLKLDETGDRELKDYEAVAAAVRRAADRGQLLTLEGEIDTILAKEPR